MKKTLTAVAVSTALVLGGAAVASAAIELDANVRVRGFSSNKGTLGVDKPSQNSYDQKVQVGFKSKVSDELTGYIRLGTGTTGDNFDIGTNTTAAGKPGPTTKQGTEMSIDEAWIDYKPSSWGIKVGRQHINLGKNNFWDHRGDAPDSVIALYGDIAGTKARAMTIKLTEGVGGNTANADDLDAYMLTLDRKFNDQFTGGLNYTFLKGGPELAAGGYAPTNAGMALSNLGVNLDLKFGDLSFAIDGNKQFGTFSDTGPGTEVDADGYAVQINANYKLGNSTIGAMFAQGSGQDLDDAKGNEEIYRVHLFSTYRHNTLAGYAFGTRGGAGNLGNGASSNTGLSNLTIFQLNGATSVTCPLTGKPLSLFGAFNFLQTTEDVVAGDGTRADDLGTEIHAKGTWKLNSNLAYVVEAFYLWTDDAYTNGLGNNNIDDVYWLRHGIAMKF